MTCQTGAINSNQSPGRASMQEITRRPWNTAPAPEAVRVSAGMTSAAEKNMLHWLCQNYVNGSGHVVDAGCFLGASTVAMAAGLAENRQWPSDRKLLALDNFIVTDGMIRLHPGELRQKKAGDSFFDVFKSQISAYAGLIEAEPVDLMAVEALPGPIELLFIDIAKTKQLNEQIVRLGFPALIPGHSLVVQQDYIYELCPWIVATMEFFAERFEFIDFAFGASFLYRFKGPDFTASDIEAFARLTLPEMTALHQAAQKRVSRELDAIADGSIEEMPKDIIRQVLKLSYVELARLHAGNAAAADAFRAADLDDLGQQHMRLRIDRMAARVGA